ncbi:general substrate transporter [Pseudomassariella vexata]|uniref:General substrate transporter n=1 Tax=Pseudomassariella vexata TaxID=1141098 RepID=A0A1Y2E4F7_9PEZI|nr:general substrate transporter [Pseudomassariella vexata]ORY66399.1 general substrate transporter [Pseudomassariella vexata]
MARIPKITNTYFVAIVATVGGMLFGFDISSMSAIVVTEQYINYFNNPSGLVQGAIGSSLAAGSVLGSLIAGPVSDKWGRRDSIMFACLWWLMGTAVQVACKDYGTLIAGRILNGVCVGITSSQVPVYLAEIAKRETRGRLVIIQQLAIEWGILIMYFIGYGCSFIEKGIPGSSASFRTAWGTQFIPCVLLMVGLPFLPRSPRWLAKVGRDEEAIQTLADIQAGGNRADPLVIAEWEEISTTLQAEREVGNGWKMFFKNGMWKRTLAGVSVQAWQQMSGANVIVYYIGYVFSMAGLSGDINLISGGVQYALFIIFTTVMFFFIDKTGRRTLLIWGSIGMAICHFVVGGMLGSYGVSVPEGVNGNANVVIKVEGAASHTVIAFSYLLIIVYALTLAPVAWIYAAEVWSLGTRATGMAMAAEANWLFNFALGLFTPPAFVTITWKVFIIFGVLCIAAAAQAFLTYPETCGKTIEEIEGLFAKGAPYAWTTKKGGSRLEEKIQHVAERKENGEYLVVPIHQENATADQKV